MSSDDWLARFPEILLDARTSAGLNREEVARKVGVSRQTVDAWENGYGFPSLPTFFKIARLFDWWAPNDGPRRL
jgi:putative transcriptional regulator